MPTDLLSTTPETTTDNRARTPSLSEGALSRSTAPPPGFSLVTRSAHLVTVTPDMAREWRQLAIPSRGAASEHVEFFVGLLQRGEWLASNDAIAFVATASGTPVLANGLIRCEATPVQPYAHVPIPVDDVEGAFVAETADTRLLSRGGYLPGMVMGESDVDGSTKFGHAHSYRCRALECSVHPSLSSTPTSGHQVTAVQGLVGSRGTSPCVRPLVQTPTSSGSGTS